MLPRKLVALAAFLGLADAAPGQYPTPHRPVRIQVAPARSAEPEVEWVAAGTRKPAPPPEVGAVLPAAATQPAPLPIKPAALPKAPLTALPDVPAPAPKAVPAVTVPPTAPPPAKPAPAVVAPTPAPVPPAFYIPAPVVAPAAACAPDCDPACGPAGTAWVNFQWLYWVTSGQGVPPLATASPVGTARPLAGTLGAPTTTVLTGGRRANNDFRNGFRVTGGLWLTDDHTFGIEGDFFFLGRSRDGFAAASDGSQVLARPFFNALTGRPDAELVSFPGVLAGSVTTDARSSVIGGGVNAVHNLCCSPCGRVDLLYGYRYFNVTDDLVIREDLTSLAGASRVPPGFHYQITDSFRTENNFHGGLIGLSGERRFDRLFVGGRASVALGGNTQVTEISGSTVITPPGGVPVVFPGGLLAQPSNIGRHSRTAFAVMPEVGVRAGVQVTDHARLSVGYNFLYLSSVARAGDQVDLRVNPAQLPPAPLGIGPAAPGFPAHTTDFWIHGVNAGLELRF